MTAFAHTKPQRTQRKSNAHAGERVHLFGEPGFKAKLFIFLCNPCVLCGKLLFIG
jgi:hypothetical protein